MDVPVKVAFCPLFFAANGGQFTELGMPIFGGHMYRREEIEDGWEDGSQPRSRDAFFIASMCDKAFDCGQCELLHEWTHHRVEEGWEHSWECEGCILKWLEQHRESPLYEWRLTGFYQSGVAPDVTPEDVINYDQDLPQCDGCFSCGRSSSFLQLVLRRARR